MKGMVSTGKLLRTVLDKKYNLRTENRMSLISVIDLKKLDRIIIITDPGMNTYPDLQIKKQIIENAVRFMHSIYIENLKVAVLAAIGYVNDEMPSTLDATLLTKLCTRNQIRGCIVDGPLALSSQLLL